MEFSRRPHSNSPTQDVTINLGQRRNAHHTPVKFLLANASPSPETHFGHAQTWHYGPSEKEEARYLALSAVPDSTSAFRTSSKTFTFLRQTRPDAQGWSTSRLWPPEKRIRATDRVMPLWPLREGQLWAQKIFFSRLDSGYAFLARMLQKQCAHHATPIGRFRKWGQSTHPWLQNASKAPRGGSGGLITVTGPRGRPLWFWGFTFSHFLLTSWKPLGGI